MSSLKIFASTTLFLAATGLLTASAPYLLTADGMMHKSPVVAMMAYSQLTVGDRFASVGAFGTAVEAYRVAADLTRTQEKLPVDEIRRIANAQYYAADYRGAARTLDQLTEEAAIHGDVVAEFWATVDAARMASLGGAEGFARWYTIRAQRLLESPDLDDETRGEMKRKLAEANLTVFAPHLSSW
ncbi:MAG: hypothetical protein JSV86_08970 [Gemmatimonadota bacterium]|nr:MAG: hypothetical protein JSV86_08970 [Gemmatimonadota bacterium]